MDQAEPISVMCNAIFQQCIEDYHEEDSVTVTPKNPHAKDSLESLLYLKAWIDTVQWHLEDNIRDPQIMPEEALRLKRAIDASNQRRTDVVEGIDDWFGEKFNVVQPLPEATINTETPAWAIDRLCILALKIYHMAIEAEREEASEAHREACAQKLYILLSQQADLSLAIDQLLEDIAHGRKYMTVYRQMKMYNDETLNPVLYGQKK